MLEISNEMFRTQTVSGVICILMVAITFFQQKFTVMGIHWNLLVSKYCCCCIYVSFSIYVEVIVCLWIKQFLFWNKKSLYK